MHSPDLHIMPTPGDACVKTIRCRENTCAQPFWDEQIMPTQDGCCVKRIRCRENTCAQPRLPAGGQLGVQWLACQHTADPAGLWQSDPQLYPQNP